MEGCTSALSFISQLPSKLFAVHRRSATQTRKRSSGTLLFSISQNQRDDAQQCCSASFPHAVENGDLNGDNERGTLATTEPKVDEAPNEDQARKATPSRREGSPPNSPQIRATHKEGISFLNGAKDVTITGNPTFTGHYHQYHHHHHYYHSPSPLIQGAISGVTFVDLTGREYAVSVDHAISRELFCKAVHLFFHGDVFEAYFQREEMEWGSYELVTIHHGTEIIKLDDKAWQSNVEVGMKVVMFPTFTAYERYQCPQCQTWLVIDPEIVTVDCQCCNFNLEPAQDDTRWLFPCNSKQRVAKNQMCRAFEREMRLAAIAGIPAFSKHLDSPKDRYVKWLLSG